MIVIEQEGRERTAPAGESFGINKSPFELERDFIKAKTGGVNVEYNPTPVSSTAQNQQVNIAANVPANVPPAEGYPTRQYVAPQAVKKSAWDKIQEVMNTSIPKPTYDANRPEEMKRLARASALAKGFNLIGDMVAVGKNANVNKRQPDNKELMYLDNMYRYMDNYSNRLDDWNYKDFVNRLRGAELGLQQENIAADNARRDKLAESADAKWRADYLQKGELADKNFKNQKELEELQGKNRLEQINAQNKGDLNEVYAREAMQMKLMKERMAGELAKYQAKAMTDGKNFRLYDNSGNAVAQLDPGETEKLIQLILKDPNTAALAEKDIQLMRAQFGEGLNQQAMKNIVAYYYDKSPLALEFLGMKEPQQQSGLDYMKQITTESQQSRPPYVVPGTGQQTQQTTTENKSTVADKYGKYRRN